MKYVFGAVAALMVGLAVEVDPLFASPAAIAALASLDMMIQEARKP